MKFLIVSNKPSETIPGEATVYLRIDHWNDFSFVTMFRLYFHDGQDQLHDLGEIKIGFKGQTTEISTYTKLPESFENLGDEFFSLGQDVDFYREIALLPNNLGKEILLALRDIVLQPTIIVQVQTEKVFSISLLRFVSLSIIKGQFARVLEGKATLTDFKFKFIRPESNKWGGIELAFNVVANSIPSTNIHAVIGRNGIGKTTLLNGMIESITGTQNSSQFVDAIGLQEHKISNDYFSSLVSVSFSAFDPFTPPKEQSDPAKGTLYFYIGLKDSLDSDRHRTISDLHNDCARALLTCFYKPEKTERWLKAIEKLGSDENFSSMRLDRLELFYRELRDDKSNQEQSDTTEFREKYLSKISPFLSGMSSGHSIVLLTITRLLATVEEKTLVLIDEPESHLHPPLLSAFIRALADLLHDQNGVAIIATHSPVVLQEITKSCIWKIYRVGKDIQSSRPTIETFGENVGLLTSEVFSLEVERAGFHDLLSKSVKGGQGYEQIVAEYNNQLGFEARAILKALVANRDRGTTNDEAG